MGGGTFRILQASSRVRPEDTMLFENPGLALLLEEAYLEEAEACL